MLGLNWVCGRIYFRPQGEGFGGEGEIAVVTALQKDNTKSHPEYWYELLA